MPALIHKVPDPDISSVPSRGWVKERKKSKRKSFKIIGPLLLLDFRLFPTFSIEMFEKQSPTFLFEPLPLLNIR